MFWGMYDEGGQHITSLKELQQRAIDYFAKMNKGKVDVDLTNQLDNMHIYPNMFNVEDNQCIGKHITIEEVATVL